MIRVFPILLLTAAVAAGEGARLRFTRAADMPEAGIRLQLPAGAVPEPLPPPNVFDGRRTSGGESERVELQNPLEVWRWKQFLGKWVDERGNRLVLASPTLAVLPDSPPLVPKAEVAPLLSSLAVSARGWNGRDLERWLEAFWGVSGLKGEALQRGRPFGLAEVFVFSQAGPGDRGAACAFRLNAAPEAWKVVIVMPGPGGDLAAVEKALREDFLPSVEPLSRRAAPAAAAPVPRSDAGSPREESRQRARESIRNMKGWWYAESENTIVLSNIRSGKSQMVDAILEDLEILRPVWTNGVPPWEPIREMAVVRVFDKPDEYVRYVGPEQEWTAGLFVASRRELAIRSEEEGSAFRKRRALLEIIYHEAFHQYLDVAFDRIQAAPWFNEGYASLYGCVGITGRRVTFEKDPERVSVLVRLAREGRADLEALIGMDYRAFYGGDDQARREHYALAWGFLYFLQGEPNNRKAAPFRGVLARYAAALRETRDPQLATRLAFEGVSMAELKKAFQAYWK